MDPWAIDLVSFTSLYMARVKDGAQIDLITAGKLLHMAWSILRLQSEKLRLSAEPPVVVEPEPADPWGDIDASWAEDDPDRAYNERIIQGEDVLDEKVRHKGDRKVTLMELVEALEEARREADLRATIVEKREAEKAHRSALRRGRAEGAAHKEDPESDIREVWERILGQNGVPIPITSIQERSKDDMVRTLVSILFLARENKIRIWQENFPYGMIYVQNPNATPHATVELKNAQN
jgi:segregation and condensation protein A